jgi:hypothetical protein
MCCPTTLRAHSTQSVWVLQVLFTVALKMTAVAVCTSCAHRTAHSEDHALHPGIGEIWHPGSDRTQSIKSLLAAAKADTVAAALMNIGITCCCSLEAETPHVAPFRLKMQVLRQLGH